MPAINSSAGTAFSFEVLPPLKGVGTGKLFGNIDRLMEFNPGYINITTHHSEPVYQDAGNGMFRLASIRRRPGTVAVANAIHHRYGIPVVPHILCNGYTLEDTEYVLIDLQLSGISDILVLRGDKCKGDANTAPAKCGRKATMQLGCYAWCKVTAYVCRTKQEYLITLILYQFAKDRCMGQCCVIGKTGIVENVYLVHPIGEEFACNAADVVPNDNSLELHAQFIGKTTTLTEQFKTDSRYSAIIQFTIYQYIIHSLSNCVAGKKFTYKRLDIAIRGCIALALLCLEDYILHLFNLCG